MARIPFPIYNDQTAMKFKLKDPNGDRRGALQLSFAKKLPEGKMDWKNTINLSFSSEEEVSQLIDCLYSEKHEAPLFFKREQNGRSVNLKVDLSTLSPSFEIEEKIAKRSRDSEEKFRTIKVVLNKNHIIILQELLPVALKRVLGWDLPE